MHHVEIREGGEKAWQRGRLSERRRWETAVFTGDVLVADLACLELNTSLRENKVFWRSLGEESQRFAQNKLQLSLLTGFLNLTLLFQSPAQILPLCEIIPFHFKSAELYSLNGSTSHRKINQGEFYSLSQEEEMATHSSILAWRIPWTEEPAGYSPWGHKKSDTAEWLPHFHFMTSAVMNLYLLLLLFNLMFT